jgi:hypothetical protein
VSDALTAAARADLPDPHQDRPAAGAPSRTGRILGFVRRLIHYGKGVAGVLRQHVSVPNPAIVAREFGTHFGTSDIALILARITRGLLLAAALQARLISDFARKQKQSPAPILSPRKPHPARPAVARAPRRAEDDPASLLARMPTAEEIAAQVRRRPVEAVIADICSDLGIVTTNPLWRELRDVVSFSGAGFRRLMRDLFKRTIGAYPVPPETPFVPPMPPGWQPPPRRSFAEAFGTGPP